MKRKLRGIKRRDIQLDFTLYRVDVPIPGVSNANLSVIDIWPEGAQQTIMFVHGYAGCAETWEFQANYFARNYRVIVPDLRGHGQSDAPYTDYTMPELTADLQAIVTRLNLPEKFILVGHSFGGSICVEYANAHPERLEKLILIATAGEYPLPKLAALVYRIPTPFFRFWWKYRPRWNAEIHVVKRMMLNNLMKWQGWPLVRNISTPTLVITGERDRYFPRYVFDDLGKMVPGAEIYDVGSAKHKVQLERHQAVNRAISRFVQDKERQSWREQASQPSPLSNRPWLKHYSKETPPTVPVPRQPLHKFLESAANWLPKRAAVVFYGKKLSYHELDQLVNQFAHVLHGQGVAPGDRVMVVLPNIPQMIIAYYAALKIGGVVVMPNPDADARQIVQQVKQTAPKVLITLQEFGRLAAVIKKNTDIDHFIFANIKNVMSGSAHKKLMGRWKAAGAGGLDYTPDFGRSMADLMEDASRKPPAVNVKHSDLAVIIFTSGTTDEPKGVGLSHSNLVANALQTRHWIPDLQYGQEVCLSVVPLMHSYGMSTAMNIPILLGATIVLLPLFELDQVLEHIKLHHPTLFPGVPSMYMAINQAPDVRAYGLSSIKACVSGAAPLPVEVQESFEKLTRGRLVEGYGLTEASPITHANPLYGVRKAGSIGVPIPNTDAKIIDLVSGETLPTGQIGELLVKGPQIMQGYWCETEQSTIDPESALKNGWLHTGDVAVMDNDGYFQIISRKRDTIMAGEYSVYPRDIEEVLYENNKVMEVAVVGVSTAGAESGQKVKAFVVPRPGSELTKEELLDLCRRRLAPYAVPWEIEFREELPKSFVGKVLRRMLVGNSEEQRVKSEE